MGLAKSEIAALKGFGKAESTPSGVRVQTHCLYPSFELVRVYVDKRGSSFLVHDGGEAAACAWAHGREYSLMAKSFEKSASKFDCSFEGNIIKSVAENEDWIRSSVIAVANAASDAANAVVSKIAPVQERGIERRVEILLSRATWRPHFVKHEVVIGASGKAHTFDFVIRTKARTTLIDTVVPHPSSVSAKFVAFSDTERSSQTEKYAVYDAELETADKVLLLNVADLISLRDLEKTDARAFLN